MKQKAKHLSILLAFSLILGSIPGISASAAKKVSITKKATVTVGKKTKIKLKNNKKKVTWKVASGKKKGTAKVEAKVGKKKYTCKVTVETKAKATPKPTKTPTPTANPTTEPTATPTKTPGQDGVLTLYYNGENVEEIWKQTQDSGLPVHIIVEDSVTSIGEWAFVNCSNLTSITWDGNTYASLREFFKEFEAIYPAW